jgi:hypothetical protein
VPGAVLKRAETRTIVRVDTGADVSRVATRIREAGIGEAGTVKVPSPTGPPLTAARTPGSWRF